MTIEEAKEILSIKVKPCVLGEWGEAIDMAIESLSDMPIHFGYCKDCMSYNGDGEKCKWGLLTGERGYCQHFGERTEEPQITSAEPSKVDFRTDKSANIGTEVNDLISREDAMEKLNDFCKWCKDGRLQGAEFVLDCFLPNLPSADRPHGEWVEMETLTDEDSGITEWQSARCSVCGKYHTTPYMYYFDRFNYCPNCGAVMSLRGEEDE